MENLQSGFMSPADVYKPHVWWHWMNGHVTREGITRDLEEMKRAGLAGFTLFNTHEGVPRGPVKYASLQWWQLLGHTMDESERLDLKMGMFNGAGWSATGAAFVTPEMAMQEVAWTEAKVSGPSRVSITLDVPKAALGLDRDMKRDPIVNRRYYVAREKVTGFFRDIAVFAVPAIPIGEKPWQLRDLRNKTGYDKPSKAFCPDERIAPSEQIIRLEQIIDVSDYMDEKGILNWDAPPGVWTILRMGYQPTARQNHPASWGGAGLEIDKMSSDAMDYYWDNFLNRVVDIAAHRVGTTFDHIMIDSFEAGHQNWSHDFPHAFLNSRGYDFRKVLPVVTGRVVDSVDFTERVLWDYRHVIGDLIAKNYYGRMSEHTAKMGLNFAHEPYGSFGNTNDFVVAGIGDMPMCEWWAYDDNQGRPAEAKLVASASHTFGKKIVGAEAFTGRPERIFETYPGGIKSQGDYYFSLGINRFNFHTWVHDPYHVPPGLGLGTYGSRFDNRNTWWPFATAWFEYLSRCQFMLQQGEFIGDVIYYVGEEAPLRSEEFRRGDILPDLPKGYDYAFCNSQILSQLKFEDDRLKTMKGSSFRILVLSDSPWMSLAVLKKIDSLVAGGAIVVGSKPASLPGKINIGQKEKFDSLVNKIWGQCDGGSVTSNRVGKGILYWGKSLDEILEEHGIEPDFTFTHTTMNTFRTTSYTDSDVEFIHRQTSDADIYFLTNQHEAAKTIDATFRVSGESPELWKPDNGKIYQLPGVKTTGAHSKVQLCFDPGEAYFVVFREPSRASASEPVPWFQDEKLIADLSAGWIVELATEEPAKLEMPKLVSWTELDDEALRYHSGTAVYKKIFNWNPETLSETPKISIDLGDVQVIARVKVNGVDCGIAWKKPYRVEVTEALKPGENTIDITVANLWVNRIIGDQQYPDDAEWTSDTGSTAKGQGLACIPDWVLKKSERPITERKTFYAWKWPHLTKDKNLLPSGLLGPVSLLIRVEQ